MSPLLVLSRVIYRTGLAVGRSRGTLLVAVLGLAALSYASFTHLGFGPNVEVAGAQATGNRDCADTIMAALAHTSPDTARAAYQCMDDPVSRRMSEEEFVGQLRQSGAGTTGSNITRVGQETTPDGGRMVFFALTRRDGAIGYIIYLNKNGKVTKME